MRIAVIGGTGLIGSRVVTALEATGHDVVVVARAAGVNSFTGEGLEHALDGVEALVDVSNSSYTDEAGAREFFSGSTLNLLTYGAAAGVAHHVVLSVVGTDRLARSEGGYFQAKAEQERLLTASGRPYSIVHATQFFEFIRSITDAATRSGIAYVADALTQPMAADDVAAAVARAALARPTGGITEHAGPEVFELGYLAQRELRFRRDEREVAADPLATYFGAQLDRFELLPGAGAVIAPTRFHDWQISAGEAGDALLPSAAGVR
ncbi:MULTISPECIES: SDR family oxidoreductase [unclassified Microbacterium]|uniref:SDR family oxidoreductase n=1 Tax=unclassified Microbacterium TaxID=2609290 RepID=UPI0006F5D335|nr:MULTISPECIES: NAD(P)H-binding protein [unclassified Microbacterium]KQP71599.1 NmrA family transcriptional regulator [Microbacterium sp. Leaf288]MDT0143027.1 NAD(P)H-binding protein [Microbacterium sp. PRC9]